jgi:general secretion pathway protein I
MNDQSGFTLVEVLVALAILSIGLAALFQGVGGGWRAASVADHERIATEGAQSLLDEIGRSRPLLDGVSEGAFAGDEHWRLTIVPLDADENQVANRILSAHLVTLHVTWLAGTVEQELNFRTLRLKAVK